MTDALEDARAALREYDTPLSSANHADELGNALRALIAEHEGFLRHRAEAINADLMRTLTLIFMDSEIGERAREIYLESTGDIAPPTDDEREALVALVHDVRQRPVGAQMNEPFADAILAAGFRRQGAIPSEEEFKDTLTSVRLRQIAKGYTPEHDDEHGIRHILNWAIDYARRGRSEDSAGMIVAALELVDRGLPPRQGAVTEAQVEAGARGIHAVVEDGTPWEDTTERERDERRREAHAALEAARDA